MKLDDYLASNYINKFRKDHAKDRRNIPFEAIRLTEMFQKVNPAMELTAEANARNMRNTYGYPFERLLASYGYNMLVSDNKDGTYNLLFGVQSYMTLKKTFAERERNAERRGEPFLRPFIRTFITDMPDRDTVLKFCRENYDLSINANLDYVDEDSLEFDVDLIDEEMDKTEENEQYNPALPAYVKDNRLYLLKGDEVYYARKELGLKRIKVFIEKSGNKEKESKVGK